ncbi:unnamed protein product [Trichobilharzia regenti]|nr:unnamed protein product [Trichobilharzia regenti]
MTQPAGHQHLNPLPEENQVSPFFPNPRFSFSHYLNSVLWLVLLVCHSL